MSNYKEYIDATKAISDCIKSKESEIQDIENEIFYLKKSKRIVDEEFKISLNKKERNIG